LLNSFSVDILTVNVIVMISEFSLPEEQKIWKFNMSGDKSNVHIVLLLIGLTNKF